MVRVGVLGLQGEDPGVGRGVELDHRLHGQRAVDEVGRLVVDVLDADDDSLVVRVCMLQMKLEACNLLRTEGRKHCMYLH